MTLYLVTHHSHYYPGEADEDWTYLSDDIVQARNHYDNITLIIGIGESKYLIQLTEDDWKLLATEDTDD